jgi:anti-sigma-K factor RskA
VHGMSERDNILAAEFVAGLLAPAQRVEAEQRIERDRDFARLVEQWRTRLSDLDDTAPLVTPDAALWQRIEGQIGSAAPAVTPLEFDRRPARGNRRIARIRAGIRRCGRRRADLCNARSDPQAGLCRDPGQ